MRHRWHEGGDVITGRGGRTLTGWSCLVCTATVYTSAKRPRIAARCAGPCHDLGGWTGMFCRPPVPEPLRECEHGEPLSLECDACEDALTRMSARITAESVRECVAARLTGDGAEAILARIGDGEPVAPEEK